MNTYIELHIRSVTHAFRDIIMAKLADAGYDGFLEEEEELKAYINKLQFDPDRIDDLQKEFPFSFIINEIREENWNAIWESSFEPVLVDRFVAIRAEFHDVVENVEHEIIITPKMSFGTGHHATTFLMILEMADHNWQSKTVLDFGTGTGVLAILADKLGAAEILAIDNDPWCIENGRENMGRNNVKNMSILLAGEIPPRRYYDIILANINKHILLANASILMESLNNDGILIMSGLLTEDLADIKQAYKNLGEPLNTREKNNWLLISFMK